MMKMEPPQRLLSSPRKFFQSQRSLNTFSIFFLIFGCGLAFGITLSFCFENNPFNLKIVEQLFSISPLRSQAPPTLLVEESRHLSINETSNLSTGKSSNSSYDEPPNLSMNKPPHPAIDEPPNISVDDNKNNPIDEPTNFMFEKHRTNDPQFQPNNNQHDPPFDEPPNLPANKPSNPTIDNLPNPSFGGPKKESSAIGMQENEDSFSNPIDVQENVKKEGIQQNIDHEAIPMEASEYVLPKPNLQLQPQQEAQPLQQIQLEPQPKPNLESNVLTRPQPLQQSEPDPQPKTLPLEEPQLQSQPFQQLQLEPQPKPQFFQQPQLKPQPMPHMEPNPLADQPQPLQQSELQPEPNTLPLHEPQLQPEPKPQPFQQLQLEPQSNPQLQPQPLQQSQPLPQQLTLQKPQLQPQGDKKKMKDDELFLRALRTPNIPEDSLNRVQKVAFMFLVRGVLPLAPLWDMFFKGHEGFYSIYVHTQPFFKGEVAEESIFHGRRIQSKKVEWGKISMVEAERRLLANALLDSSNERFVLLSEACIPLHNFTTLYSYLMGSSQTFVESYDLPGPVGRGRYNSRMKPTVKLQQWRKGSQWKEVDRFLAREIVADCKYFSLFRRYCKPACYSDEHYIPTYTSIKFWKMNSNRTLTWVDWSKGGPHPSRFERDDVTPEFLQRMRYGMECLYNGKPSNMCYMFARKFSPNALSRLLELAPQVLNFNF